MPNHFKTTLIACLIALPSFVFAAENATEAKPAAPAQTAVSTPAAAAPKPVTAAQSTRIGYVDIARIGTESERGKALRIRLLSSKDKLQSKIEVKKKALDKQKSSIEAKIATMTPKQREAKSREFQKKVEEFQKLVQTSEQEFIALQEKETRTLYEEIERASVEHGKANGYAAIVVKKELLYTGSSVDAKDVTDDLIKILNQTDQKK